MKRENVRDGSGGEPLSRLLDRPVPIERFLPLAISITDAVRLLHAQGLIHQDLKPEHILVDSPEQVRLTGLELASRLARERHLPESPQLLTGTFAYMAPEQTGRMNRSVDSRSDLYALGVVFYRMLTGKLPFNAADPLEWVHCHIARQPARPGATVPEVLADIVLKLLAKTAEDRYQTAAGLRIDLQRCLACWQRAGRIEPFPLAQQDAPDHLFIPERLYGRENEVAALQAGLRRATGASEPVLMLVCGYSGIGKSAVVAELQPTIIAEHAMFAAGKFDQYERNRPYAVLAQASGSLVKQLLGKSAREIEHWRQMLLDALTGNGQIVANLVPEIELIIGKQPPLPELSPEDTANRFRHVFGRFLRVFATAEHALVLFFDDLQWVDVATLDFLQYLATELTGGHLLLIGAYRDNEVDTAHPLTRRLEAIRAAGAEVHQIVLKPLPLAAVRCMVCAVLRCSGNDATTLADVIFEKTGGNPFFVIQFLTNLEAEGLLSFDRGTASWHWDARRIAAKGFTDNVVSFVIGRLTRLPEATQNALQKLAAAGKPADLATLATILDVAPEGVESILRAAVAAGLLVHTDDAYSFSHDRVQEAAYSLVPQAERAPLHLRIGRALWRRARDTAEEQHIFDIADQLNRGAELITDADEREQVARLNLTAGQRARVATAYAAAIDFAQAGLRFLRADCWSTCYTLAFELEFTLGECYFLTSNLQAAESRLTGLATRAATLQDRARLTALRIALYENLGRNDLAVAVSLAYLRDIGIFWTAQPTKEQVQEEYAHFWRRLGDRRIEDLVELPVMTDPDQQSTLDVLGSSLAGSLSDRNLFHLYVGRMANLSLEHGNTDASTLAYLYLNAVLGEEYGDYRSGYRFGKLAIDLVERGLDRFAARVQASFGSTVVPWTRPLREGLPWVLRAIDSAGQRGDLTFAAYSYYLLPPHRLLMGDPLEAVQRETERGVQFARKLHFEYLADAITVPLLFIRALSGAKGEAIDEDALRQRLEATVMLGNALCWYWIRKLQLAFLTGDFAGAMLAEAHAYRHFRPLLTAWEDAEYHFFAALTRAARFPTPNEPEQAVHRQALLRHEQRLEELANDSSENFAARATLIAAERARIEGRLSDAQDLYEQAIHLAVQQGFVHDEAVACETAARYYESRGLSTVALGLFRSARSCYARWGAAAKVKLLELRYPALCAETPGTPASRNPFTDLDFVSLLRAAQAISGEIVLDRLIESLLTLTVEQAGAERGVLMLFDEGEPRIAAQARSLPEKVEVTTLPTHVAMEAVPASILQYVTRTRERLLLGDACTDSYFVGDAYVQRERPRSVLCQPLIKRSKLMGVLYLENKLTPNAFSSGSSAVLDVLGAQAAISLQNALLYEDLREQESRIRRLVDSNLIGIFFWSRDGAISEANDAFLQLVGYTREDLAAGRVSWSSTTPSEYQTLDAAAAAQFAVDGNISPYEKEFLRKDGSRVPVLIGCTLLEHSQDRGVAFVLDLTEHREIEAERSARKVAEEANRAKSEFLAGMSHELRTPLNAILGYAQILERDEKLDDREHNSIGVIRHSGEHLLTLINDVLDLAKIEAGKVLLDEADVQLTDVMRVIREIIEVKAEQKGLALIWDIAPDLPPGVHVDERRLRQVLLNLLANAINYTDHGHVRLIARRAPGKAVHFEVQDTGIGIPQDRLDAIFQPFEQAGDVDRRKVGTGLGLAISRQMVRLMGGDIHVTSRLNQGSRFWFDLELPAVDVASATVSTRPAVTGYEGPRKTVLVVDDAIENRQVLVDLLAPLGFATIEAENGHDALQKARSRVPDLVITDYVMPLLDGQQLTRELRADAATRGIPIIMLSAHASDKDNSAGFAAGTDAFLSKPFDVYRLLSLVRELLQLEWTPTSGMATSHIASSAAQSLVVPPTDELRALHALAREGNMRKIAQWAEQLAADDERYQPFAIQLTEMARQYQSRAILQLVESHLRG